MREIKFRCWQRTYNENEGESPEWQMIDADDLAFESYEPLTDLLTNDEDSEIFLQYTGQTDGNVEIYEGDILHSEELNENLDVFYNDGAFRILFKNDDESEVLTDKTIRANNLYVIGNIYENPELLNK